MENPAIKFLLIGCLFVGLSLPFSTGAQATADTSIVIQPAKIEVTANPGQNIARTFSIINRSNYSVTLKLVVKDYQQISSDGKLDFYDAPTESAATWLIPQFLEIGLKPLETKDIEFVASVPQNFSGGGHYGAILFQPVGSDGNAVANNFGELVLLTVTGSNVKATSTIKAANFWTGAVQQGNPVGFNFNLQNDGNTHFDAQSKLVLSNWLGKEIGNYNIGQLIVYPKTSRVFKWQWNNTPFIGLYKADVMVLNPDNNKFESIGGKWFVLFPWEIALVVLVLGAGAFVSVKLLKS